MSPRFAFPFRTAATGVAAAVFSVLAMNRVAAGPGLRAAYEVLDPIEPAQMAAPFVWAWVVRFLGADVGRLVEVSMVGAILCAGLVAWMTWRLFGAAVLGARERGVGEIDDYVFVRGTAVFLAVLGFAFTPGLLSAATRIGPLAFALLPPLAAVALVVGVAVRSAPADGTLIDRLSAGKVRLLLSFLLVVYSGIEIALDGRSLSSLAFPALGVWFAVGVAPGLVIAWSVRRRWLVSPKAHLCALGGWALAVVAMGAIDLVAGGLEKDREAARLVSAILRNAEQSGRIAVVSEGELDDLFFFLLPQGMRMITVAREQSPAYGRHLAAWVREEVKVEGEGKVEDLVFAAELGAGALLDEWKMLDESGLRAAVATIADYFPTVESWHEACGIVRDAPGRFGARLRRLVARAGNHLGCALLERGAEAEAWGVFRETAMKVDYGNYTALLNLAGMCGRGYRVSKDEAEDLARRCREQTARYATPERIQTAVRLGGRLYIDPATVARQEQERRTRARSSEQTEREKSLVTALSIGDWELVEHDAIRVLREDRHHVTANAVMGAINGTRGDYAAAERYLRRASREGDSALILNDLAFTLARRGEGREAVPLAREAVRTMPDNWNFRETLAYALIRAGETDEGERELVRAEADCARERRGRVLRFALDRAWLCRMRGDDAGLDAILRNLLMQPELTASQEREIDELL